MGRRYNPYMFEDNMQPVVVPRRGMSRRAKLLAGLAAAGTLYGTRNMKYGAGTLGRKAWNSDRVQSGLTKFAKSDLGGRVAYGIQGAQNNVGLGPIDVAKGGVHKTLASGIGRIARTSGVRAVQEGLRKRRYS